MAEAKHTGPSWIRGGGVVLVALGAVTMLVGVISVVSDSFPTRVGVTKADEVIYIVPLACPGERVKEITLSNADGEDIWSASGDVAIPERIELGVAPESMTVTRPLVGHPPTSSELSLWIRTNELGRPTAMVFTLDDVPTAPFVLDASHRIHESVELFRQAERKDSPCGDPFDERSLTRWILTLVISGALLIAAGVAVLTLPRRRAQRVGSL